MGEDGTELIGKTEGIKLELVYCCQYSNPKILL